MAPRRLHVGLAGLALSSKRDLFVAGTDTTSNSLEWAMAEVLRNPHTMAKAKEELKDVTGKGKLVDEADISRLPYLQCIVKETLRLHPPVPLLIPRKTETKVTLDGYIVPKGTQVLVNVWAIGRDPSTWDNSLEFKPERFLNSELDVRGRDFELLPFGGGRRICPGRDPSTWDNSLEFKPERFLNSELDVRGRDFELLPFGGGRRICPGLPLAVRMLPVMLGSLLNNFDWDINNRIGLEELDMNEKFGITLQKAEPLCLGVGDGEPLDGDPCDGNGVFLLVHREVMDQAGDQQRGQENICLKSFLLIGCLPLIQALIQTTTSVSKTKNHAIKQPTEILHTYAVSPIEITEVLEAKMSDQAPHNEGPCGGSPFAHANCHHSSETTYFNKTMIEILLLGVGDGEPLDGDPCDGNGVFLLVHREVKDQGTSAFSHYLGVFGCAPFPQTFELLPNHCRPNFRDQHLMFKLRKITNKLSTRVMFISNGDPCYLSFIAAIQNLLNDHEELYPHLDINQFQNVHPKTMYAGALWYRTLESKKIRIHMSP
ncbi:geraniol 10-hydroxylase [Artemisia annua]|uniref:Geraniol 10-hydroxylase n=1 Tax=Artemisia annua TaxID=35608 RepID=A0A2U1QDJ4_ARTAN|nr:geraniol 10-hydroxylase [Artemisia annua]